jgi:lipid II:glycine glycyltransferase (peptidoglycan interpeptide bridge formation enzyme)
VVTWKLIADAQALAGWDRDLHAHDDYSIYQTLAWGEHRRASGWVPYRWAAFDGERIVGMAQGLLRRYPGGIGVMWMPGGPAGEVAVWNEDFQQAVFHGTGLRALYCRFNSFKNRRDDDERLLAGCGWRRPRSRLTTGLSLHYDLARPETGRLAACSRNWRHNLKRSEKYGLTVERWTAPAASALRSIYTDMEDYKHLAQQHSEDDLRSLFEHLGDRVVVYRCRDASGAMLACRACAVMGDKAWDLLAATAVAGRKSYASYAAFWALTQHCHQQGIRHYDLAGVDPAGNRGVYDFKRGTGATRIEYLGEWEWAYPGLISLPANWLIGMRRSAM